jgi:ASC-1-like (ASCH) protein
MSTTKIYFRNVKTGRRYEIVRFSDDKKHVVLRGEVSEFKEPYDKERFKQLGYELEREA